ncbi:MAG: polysaccharide deacetylase family protein [Waddliaceae bacterium]
MYYFFYFCILAFAFNLPGEEKGFERPLISITFDDEWVSIYKNGLPILNAYGYPATFYIHTFAIGRPSYMTEEMIRDLHQSGFEIGSATVTHPYLSTLPLDVVEKELVESKNRLRELIGVDPRNFAVTFGDFSQEVIALIKKYYRSNRTTIPGFNIPGNFNPYLILAEEIDNSTSMELLEMKMDWAQKNHAWLVLLYHRVDTEESTTSISPDLFNEQMGMIRKRDMTVLTVDKALDEIMGQL